MNTENNTQIFVCKCGYTTTSTKSLRSHHGHCKTYESERLARKIKNDLKKPTILSNGIYICQECGKEHNGSYKSGRFCSEKCRRSYSAKFAFKNKHHSIESRKQIRISTLKYLKNCNGFSKPRFNVNSILFFDNLSRKMGWNLQHAKNGGEIQIDGYFLDAYDKDKNIVVEYDEKAHYIDVLNNVLTQKDIDRQTYIIKKLHCDFYRYNETTKVLWKVN